MTKIFTGLFIITAALMAELHQVWVTPQFAEKNIKIIDIRQSASGGSMADTKLYISVWYEDA